ncbi:MAG: hypothetical protein C5B52_02030 [Bacteroidetes bacterium]|nr:MAG: hypothetical protein C5B52_02030 [Bacteroidota bacterium]
MKRKKNEKIVIRLKPGMDLKRELDLLTKEEKIEAGWILSAVGSLTNYVIRFANQPKAATAIGHFELVSLTGTLSKNGSHLHISISNEKGATIGGHLLEGCLIYTTMEIIIEKSNEYSFTRKKDKETGWKELAIKKLNIKG